MSESTTTVYRIEALRGAENYNMWKIKMMDILTDQGLLEYADGTSKVPNDKDRKTLSMIRLRVGDGPLVYIAGSRTSNEAWGALQAMYEARGPIGIVTVRRKLSRAQCEDGGDIEEHIRTLRGYVEELAGLGLKINDEDFSITLLTPLPDSWDAFISSVDSSTLKESHWLIARILEEDRRILSRNGVDTALSVGSSTRIKCFECYKRGLKAADCPRRNNDSSDESSDGTSDNDWKKRDRYGRGKGRKKRHHSPEPDRAHQASGDYAFPADPTSQPDMAIRALERNAMLADSVQ